jgi:hypothetical protein
MEARVGATLRLVGLGATEAEKPKDGGPVVLAVMRSILVVIASMVVNVLTRGAKGGGRRREL